MNCCATLGPRECPIPVSISRYTTTAGPTQSAKRLKKLANKAFRSLRLRADTNIPIASEIHIRLTRLTAA
jgi:hypothetical protein